MVIFSKILSNTDIRRRCVVPMKYFRSGSFPKPSLRGINQEDFVVKDEDGCDWILGCSIRSVGDDPNRPKHKKPVLIKQWIPFVRSKALCVGDRVIIYEEEDGAGFMQRRINVEKHTCPYEAHRSPFMKQNLDGDEDSSSTSHSSANESTVSRIKATTIPGNDKKHIPASHATSQDLATRHKTKRPRLSLSLDFTLDSTTTRGTRAATTSIIDKKQKPTFQSHSQDTGCYSTETPSLSLDLGLTLRPTYM